MTPEEVAVEIAYLDRILVCVVLVLGFFLASFAVRNTSFWLHLASGRLLAHGEYHFGVDSFSYTPTNYWTNHSWLFDLILYSVAAAGGGPEAPLGGALVVVVKALVVTGMAWVLLLIRRPGQSLWAPAVCTGLALVAISPRLLLQPMVGSLLFLALTIYLLHVPLRSEREAVGQERITKSPLAAYWLLPALFALWVNFDSWFILGPFTVALFLLGQTLQGLLPLPGTAGSTAKPRHLGMLFVVLVVGTAACLLNPHHYHAFALPAQLSWAGLSDTFARDPLFAPFYHSLLQENLFQADARLTATGPALLLLAVLGVASFGLSFSAGWQWWRVLLWIVFAVLAFYRIRMVPFFAVVAAPITVLNFQDFVAFRLGSAPQMSRYWMAWSFGGRIGSILIGVALLVAAWPGWLHGRPGDARLTHRVVWRVEPDLSLRATAKQLKAWHEEGLLKPEDHGFNYVPDIANYCAWFCADEHGLPQEKGFFDYRFELFPDELAAEYVGVRQALRGGSGESLEPTDWTAIFRRLHINHVMLNINDPFSVVAGAHFLQDSHRWAPVDKRISIFRWNDPEGPDRGAFSQRQRFAPNLYVFGPLAEPAPVEVSPVPEGQSLWDKFLYGPSPRPLEADEAARYLDYFEQIRQQWVAPAILAGEVASWWGTAGTSAATPASATVVAPATLAFDSVPLRSAMQGGPALDYFLRGKDLGPPAMPILAIREARRAIAASPNDAFSYFTLARAYLLLWHDQEHHWAGYPPAQQDILTRQQLRRVQFVTASEYGLKLRPDNQDAHTRLFGLYRQMGYVDLALDHLRDAARYARAAGPRAFESAEDFDRRIEALDTNVQNLDSQVSTQRNELEVNIGNQPLIAKAQQALARGLGKRALELLLEAEPQQVGIAEANLQLELLLHMGRLDEVRARLTDDLRGALGGYYERYQVLLSAAEGDYKRAGEYLDQAITNLERSNIETMLMLSRGQAFQGMLNPLTLRGVTSIGDMVRQVADFRVLRGMIALEAGAPGSAAQSFEQALSMGGKESFNFDTRPIALRYLQLIKQAAHVD
jgi:hypothetical protein